MAPKESNVSKVFESNGGSKTAAAYTCLKIFEEEQLTTSSLYANFVKLQTYLDTTSDEIKKGILSRFKKDEADKLLSHRTVLDNNLMRLYQYDIKNIITYCANAMTTEIVKQHVGDSKSGKKDDKKIVPVENGNGFELSTTERERMEKERRSAGVLSYADIVTKQQF